MNEARRRLLRILIRCGMLSLVEFAPSAPADAVFGKRPHTLPPDQSIYSISGRVLVNGKEADVHTRIRATDTISTAADGRLICAVDATAMLVRSDSRVIMTAQDGDASAVGRIQVERGKALLTTAAGSTRLDTSTARLTLGSGGAYVEADPDQTYFCKCYGVASITAANDPASQEQVVSVHHSAPRYILASADSGRAIRPAPFIDHTDQELMLIEALVGRTPPFHLPTNQYDRPRPGDRY